MIYFDNASSTKPDNESLEIFNKVSLENYQNPNSIHALGMQNFNKILKIKSNILKNLHLDDSYEVIFTSGATESNNLAIKGYCHKNRNRGNKIITSKIEHESVLNVFKELESEGFSVTYLNVSSDGQIDIDQLKKTIDKDTILVSIMPVNNEVGSILDIESISKIVHNFPKCVLHCDCAQTLGKINFDFNLADLITLSGHKIYGIKGIGALIKKKKIMLNPINVGGGQENGLRSGTLDFAAISSFDYSLENSMKSLNENQKNIALLRDFLKNELEKSDEIKLNISPNQCKYILNFTLTKKKAAIIVEALSNNEIYVSSVSACNSRKEEPSHVLLAMGRSLEDAKNTIRLSFSKHNSIEECKTFIEIFNKILKEVKDR